MKHLSRNKQRASLYMDKFYFLYFTLLIFTGSCSYSTDSAPTQGSITYSISYPDDISQNGFSSFFPNNMQVLYKDQMYKLLLKGDFSIYNLEFISRANGDTCYTLFKIFDKKIYQTMGQKESLFLYSEVGKPKIQFDRFSSKTISGRNNFV